MVRTLAECGDIAPPPVRPRSFLPEKGGGAAEPPMSNSWGSFFMVVGGGGDSRSAKFTRC